MKRQEKYLDEWLNDWLNVYAKPRIKKKTYESYRGVTKQLIAQEQDKPISELSNYDCQLYLNRMYDNGSAKSTINTAKVILRQAFACAKNNGYIT